MKLWLLLLVVPAVVATPAGFDYVDTGSGNMGHSTPAAVYFTDQGPGACITSNDARYTVMCPTYRDNEATISEIQNGVLSDGQPNWTLIPIMRIFLDSDYWGHLAALYPGKDFAIDADLSVLDGSRYRVVAERTESVNSLSSGTFPIEYTAWVPGQYRLKIDILLTAGGEVLDEDFSSQVFHVYDDNFAYSQSRQLSEGSGFGLAGAGWLLGLALVGLTTFGFHSFLGRAGAAVGVFIGTGMGVATGFLPLWAAVIGLLVFGGFAYTMGRSQVA